MFLSGLQKRNLAQLSFAQTPNTEESPDISTCSNSKNTDFSKKQAQAYYNFNSCNDLKLSKYPKAKHVSVVSFSSNLGKSQNRGLMMHITHLPASRSHIGQFLDPETERFTKFLQEAKQTHWIMNPLTPMGDDLCPYNSSSRFDRNKYLVNLNKLAEPRYGSLLKEAELPEETDSKKFTLKMLQEQKDPVFKKAYEHFEKLDETHPLKQEFNEYCQKQGKSWLDNNAIYEGILSAAVSNDLGQDWRNWPESLKMLPENIKGLSFEEKLAKLETIKIPAENKAGIIKDENINTIKQFRFEQFLFDKQFQEFKQDLTNKGITLFVDLAYAIKPDGKDVWSNKKIVDLDEKNNYQPRKLTGCMPEAAYPNTQMWGQAVWNVDSKEYWEYQENSIRKILEEGCVRLDHFGGLINRGAIPSIITGKDGKEYKINDAIEQHIELQKPYIGIDGTEKNRADKDIWYDEWLEDVSKKTNEKGETLLDLYIRVAEESGLKSQNAFIVEDLGGVCATPAFHETMKKYGDKLSGLRLPVAYGVEQTIGRERSMTGNPHDPWGNDVQNPQGMAVLSGSHDPQTIMDTVEITLKNAKRNKKENIIAPDTLDRKNNPDLKDSSYQMIKLLRDSGLRLRDLKDKSTETYYTASQKLLEWMYKLPAKHMQTTISDALGINFRPNIPGFWNGNSKEELVEKAGIIDMSKVTDQKEKDNILWNMKPNTDTFGFWNMRFSKGFLDNDSKDPQAPGYKERANKFVNMMQRLFPDK
jgi:hypothetical protein